MHVFIYNNSASYKRTIKIVVVVVVVFEYPLTLFSVILSLCSHYA